MTSACEGVGKWWVCRAWVSSLLSMFDCRVYDCRCAVLCVLDWWWRLPLAYVQDVSHVNSLGLQPSLVLI